jgi:hypothetical protein
VGWGKTLKKRACQGLSQSRGMGMAPSQHPITVPAKGRKRANSMSFEGLFTETFPRRRGGPPLRFQPSNPGVEEKK